MELRIRYKAVRSNEIAEKALEAGHAVPCPWIGKLIDLEAIPEITLSGGFTILKDPSGNDVDQYCWEYLRARRREQRRERKWLEAEKGRGWVPTSDQIFLDPRSALLLPKRPYGSFLKKERGDTTYLMPAVYLIFNSRGELVYVGQTVRLSKRLEQHISTEGTYASLLRYIAEDSGLISFHRCECGRTISCKRSFRAKSRAGKDLASMVAKEFMVCPISTPTNRLLELESILQETLQPKYIG